MCSRFFPGLVLLLGVLFLFTIDYQVGQYFAEDRLDGPLRKLLDAAEHFGTPFGQLLILTVAAAMSGWWEPRIIRIFAAASAAGISADIVKLFVSRLRPHSFPFDAEGASSALMTFQGLLRFGEGGASHQSFPSAHTACAAGFAVALGWAYPQGRGAFWFLAVLVGLHRIGSAAHFPSDVCGGMALGTLVGLAFVIPGRISRRFDLWERTWRTWNPWPERQESTPSDPSPQSSK